MTADDTAGRGLRAIMENDSRAREAVAPRFDAVAALLESYLDEIELFNPALGLVGAKDRKEIVQRHILDSLSPLGIIVRMLEKTGAGPYRVADAGSGAGLPGIPLAICLPRTHFVLIERMGRRAGFLRNTVAVLGLANVEIEEAEMEKAAPGRFDAIVFRAFHPLDRKLLKNLVRLAAPGGFFAAWKGRRKNAEAEIAALGDALRGRNTEIVPCPVPFLDEERCLITVSAGCSASTVP